MTRLMTDIHELRALATVGGGDHACQPENCSCRLAAFLGWESITEERWPAAQMQLEAELRDPFGPEPTFSEYHPQGTRYDSPDAPVALQWFPVNRASVWRCRQCGLPVLRYTEFGGYYVDHRVRVLQAALVVDAPAPPQD